MFFWHSVDDDIVQAISTLHLVNFCSDTASLKTVFRVGFGLTGAFMTAGLSSDGKFSGSTVSPNRVSAHAFDILFTLFSTDFDTESCTIPGGGGTPYVMGDTYVPRFWPPFFTLAGSSTIFLGYFSHPPTAKLSFGVQKLPIFTKFDLFGPKFNFFLDLFGSNFHTPITFQAQYFGLSFRCQTEKQTMTFIWGQLHNTNLSHKFVELA